MTLKPGNLVACHVPTYRAPSGIDIGVITRKIEYQFTTEVYYSVNWCVSGELEEPERILVKNLTLLERFKDD